MTITKTQAFEARKILKQYERQRNAEKRAKRCALPCTALKEIKGFKEKMNETLD